MGVFSSRFDVRFFLNFLCCIVTIFAMVTAFSNPAFASEGDGADTGYQGPRALSASEVTVGGGCNCGDGSTMSGGSSASSSGGSSAVTSASSVPGGGAGGVMLAFGAALGVYAIGSSVLGHSESQAEDEINDITETGMAAVAKLSTVVDYSGDHGSTTNIKVDISDMPPSAVVGFIQALGEKAPEWQIILPQDFIDSGETIDISALTNDGYNARIVPDLTLPASYTYSNLYINQVLYEDVVAVVELEKVGMDYYVYITEVRASDVDSFIVSQNRPDSIFQVISAVEYVADQGGSDNYDYLPAGYNASMVQAIELPPSDTYANLFFMGPEGKTDWTYLVAGVEDATE